MKTKWIACLMLSVIALGGCSTVKHTKVHTNNRTVLRPVVDSKKATKETYPTKTERTNSSIGLVAFQQDADDDVDSLELEPAGDQGNEKDKKKPNSQSTNLTVGPLIENRVQSFGNNEQAFTLADMEQMALTNNPALAAANATVEKSAGLFHQVDVRPNPTLGYSANQLADQGTDQHTVFLEQEFVRGNKLALNREVLRHTNDAQRWEIETQRYRVLTDVRVRFYEAIAAQRQLDMTIEFANVAQKGVEVATSLKEAGEGTIIDVLQSKTLLSETHLAREQAEAAYRGAWKDLAAIAGTPNLQSARLAGDFETPAGVQDWENAYRVITSESPELAAANAIVCEKRAFLQRQQVQMVPNVTAQLGAGYDRATDSGLINFQIGAPIPIRNKNCGNIAAARADYTRALENVKRIEAAIKSRLARSAQEFESANAAVQKYEQEILPQAKESLELSEKAYKAGELAFLQVLTVRRNFYDSNIRFIQSQGRLAQASAKVDGLLLTGGLDAPLDYTTGDGLRGQSFGGQ
jgi:cobalt-zinc-cadmium efflux system outer membrane protein